VAEHLRCLSRGDAAAEETEMSPVIWVLIVVAVIAVVFGVFMYMQKERTRRLREKFGPEYDRLVHDRGNPRKAEDELLDRQERIEKMHIRELSHEEITRFSNSWRNVQAQFVDAPKDAVAEGDRLVREVMTTRGYPMSNFEQRAADISVYHPHVVEHYRIAHELALRDAAGHANTEDLRQAMVHYRALFEDLLSPARDQQVEETKR
jgi:hypothetical protein